jgi:hypothetical protein
MTTVATKRIPVDFAGERGTTYRGDVLPERTRVRSRQHPELTGVIKHWEYNRPGVLSPVPYCIGWDDSGLAHDLLGLFFVYASDDGVEPLGETDDE